MAGVPLELSKDVELDNTGAGVRNESTLIFRMTHTDGSGFPSLSVQCFLKEGRELRIGKSGDDDRKVNG